MSPAKQLALVEPEAPARIEASNHRYRADAGPWLSGATGILKIQDVLMGGDLAGWGAGLAAKAVWDVAKRPDNPDFDAALQAALDAVGEPRNRGSRVHAGISDAISDEPHVPTERDGPLWYQWSRFLVQRKPEILGTEFYVIGEYCGGQVDLDAFIDGERALIDTKTGKWKDSFPLQLAAYASAQWMAPAPEGQPVTALPKYDAFYVLLLSDTGYELKRVLETPEKYEAAVEHFRFLARTYQQLQKWAKENKAA